MKFNVLNDYRGWLVEQGYSKATAATYYKAVDFLLNDQFLMDCTKIDMGLVLQKLDIIKYKNQYSKYKNAFVLFCNFLNLPVDVKRLNVLKSQKKKKYRKLKKHKLSEIISSIKYIRDIKLKLSYQVMLNTGLRVSELAYIKKEDCEISDNSITLKFEGKGGGSESVIIHDKPLVTRLATLIADTSSGAHVFYSTNYLQAEAIKRGFQCHDLRRAFAKMEFRKTRDMQKVMKSLRHSSFKATKIYVNSKIDVDN